MSTSSRGEARFSRIEIAQDFNAAGRWRAAARWVVTHGDRRMNQIPDTVAHFLADHAPQEFCSSCLARALNLSLQTLRNDLGRLAQEPVLVRIGAACAVCSRTAVTYGLMPGRPESAEEVVAQFFAASSAETAVCHSCLAQEARLSYHDAQKAVARLRVAGVTRLAIGRCTRCTRQRAIVQLVERSG